MNRKEKIKLLEAVRDGLLMPEDIRPAKILVAFQRDFADGWEMKNEAGEEQYFTVTEFETIKQEIFAASERRQRCGMETDKIICVVNETHVKKIR
jgi:hypothetical protein